MNESRRKLLVQVAELGLPIEEQAGIPTSLPAGADDQWALLKPYVGRPIRDIPKGLVILFTVPAAEQASRHLTGKIVALPPSVRQQAILSASSENVFI